MSQEKQEGEVLELTPMHAFPEATIKEWKAKLTRASAKLRQLDLELTGMYEELPEVGLSADLIDEVLAEFPTD